MFRFKDIIYYFSVYKKYLGNRIYIVFILTLLAVVTEGFGIALILPLITLLEMDPVETEVSGFAAMLQDMLGIIGIQDSMMGILLFIGVVFLFKGVIKFLEGGYKSHLLAQLMCELRARMFDAYASMDYLYYCRFNTGHFVNLINSQTMMLIQSFDAYKNFLTTFITLIAYFGFAFLINWQFASMAVMAGGLVLLLFRRLNNYVRRLSRKSAREGGTLNKFLVQTMQSYKYIASTAEIDSLRSGIMKSISLLAKYTRSKGIASAFTNALREPLSVAVLIVIIVVQVTVLNAPLAPILVALLLIYRAMGKVMGVQSAWQKLMSNIGSLEIVEAEFKNVSSHQQINGDRVLAPLSQSIELRSLNFAYDIENENVLSDITLTIPANCTVAFVGGSGAGKSTLIDMLTLMLRPMSGELLIDGVPHQEVNLSSWRQQIGYVSQETVVFDDTIANNICMWKGTYNDDPEVRHRVEQAAERAYARSFIDELPKGFNTLVGDRGVLLSGGQRQRLFLARELYKNPCFLILDEATSALDSESELVIKKSIDDLKGSATVVIIAHRLSTIRNVDYIYVLEKGLITEQGTYDELVTIDEGSFKRMVNLQSL